MANLKQSAKRARQSEKHRKQNIMQRSRMRSLIKKTLTLSSEKHDLANALNTIAILDRYATRGLIHKNKAARHKSRIMKKINALKAVA